MYKMHIFHKFIFAYLIAFAVQSSKRAIGIGKTRFPVMCVSGAFHKQKKQQQNPTKIYKKTQMISEYFQCYVLFKIKMKSFCLVISCSCCCYCGGSSLFRLSFVMRCLLFSTFPYVKRTSAREDGETERKKNCLIK